MAKKRNIVSNSSELKTHLEAVITAIVLTGDNALVVGKKGGGKTSIGKYSLRQIYGTEGVGVIEFSPSTRREDISGSPNPLYKLTPNAAEQGIEPWLYESTMADPNKKAFLADEVTRGSQTALEEMLHRIHDETRSHRAPVYATANWLAVEERLEAVFDRFAYIIHFPGERTNIEQFLANAKPEYWHYNVPTAEQVEAVSFSLREYLKLEGESRFEHPSTASISSVLNTVVQLIDENNTRDGAAKLDYDNYRRLGSWLKVLYATGVYYSGDENFTQLPKESFTALRYCYPCADMDEQVAWQTIVDSLVSGEDDGIQQAISDMSEIFKRVAEENKNNKSEMIKQLAFHQQESEAKLKELFGETENVKKALADMRKFIRSLSSSK